MARITIYLRDEIETRARVAAKEQGISVSRWVAGQLTEKLAASWPAPVLEAFGAVPDFPELEELRSGYGDDARRAEVAHKSSRKPRQNLADFLSESPFAGSELDLEGPAD